MTKGKLQKILSVTSIVGLFVVVGLLILMITGIIPWSLPIVDILLIFGILCLGCVSCLGTVRYFNQSKKQDIAIWCVVGFTALTCLLWIIFVFVGQAFITAAVNGEEMGAGLIPIWNFAKIVILLTIITFMGNLVIGNICVLKKRMIPFQVVMYISNAIVCIWLAILVLSINLSTENGLRVGATFLFGRFPLTLFILAAAFTSVASGIIKSIQKRLFREATEDLMNNHNNQPVKDEQDNSVEGRIKKLDELKAKNLITEEEYSNKKAKILEEL